MESQIVIFELSGGHFGLDAAVVEGIYRLSPVVPAEAAPESTENVTLLSGAPLPVLDLRKYLGLPPVELTGSSRYLVINLNGTRAGLTVDAISEVLPLPEEAIEPLPRSPSAGDPGLITGAARLYRRLVILLDLASIRSFLELSTLQLLPKAA
jgi:purine-binding chemotaxis protein CheW